MPVSDGLGSHTKGRASPTAHRSEPPIGSVALYSRRTSYHTKLNRGREERSVNGAPLPPMLAAKGATVNARAAGAKVQWLPQTVISVPSNFVKVKPLKLSL